MNKLITVCTLGCLMVFSSVSYGQCENDSCRRQSMSRLRQYSMSRTPVRVAQPVIQETPTVVKTVTIADSHSQPQNRVVTRSCVRRAYRYPVAGRVVRGAYRGSRAVVVGSAKVVRGVVRGSARVVRGVVRGTYMVGKAIVRTPRRFANRIRSRRVYRGCR